MTCEACGWAAAVLSMLAFGSFGAPIKSRACKNVDIDPLAFQSYKTFMCFATSWLVLLLGQEFSFSPFGIVSGLFWVPGGTCMVYAIKQAGLAVAMGIGSSCIVLVSFTWGIFIFHEKVESRVGASFAVFMMMVGLWGMSHYSSPEATIPNDEMVLYSGVARDTPNDTEDEESYLDDDDVLDSSEDGDELLYDVVQTSQEIPLCGWKVSKRKLGMASAVVCGSWGGSIMVPMKYAPPIDKGMGYVISFAIGASIVTIFLWILRYTYNVGRTRSVAKAYQALPSLHIRVMWLPGGLAGLLWSTGNFFSIISVDNLGEGVGYSVCQAAMLVSGLWGIFYFKEITNAMAITKWFASAGLTIAGILLLSYEHHEVQ